MQVADPDATGAFGKRSPTVHRMMASEEGLELMVSCQSVGVVDQLEVEFASEVVGIVLAGGRA